MAHLKTMLTVDCGTVGRAVASCFRSRQFESSHSQFFAETVFKKACCSLIKIVVPKNVQTHFEFCRWAVREKV